LHADETLSILYTDPSTPLANSVAYRPSKFKLFGGGEFFSLTGRGRSLLPEEPRAEVGFLARGQRAPSPLAEGSGEAL